MTDDKSAGLKWSATVRTLSTLVASLRLFLAGSADLFSALVCWYVSLPSAIYILKKVVRLTGIKVTNGRIKWQQFGTAGSELQANVKETLVLKKYVQYKGI